MTDLERTLRDAARMLESEEVAFALVGGLAVSARTEPRFTRDVDLAVAVADDRGAESVVQCFRRAGYGVDFLAEHEAAERLATARILTRHEPPIILDLLFASSGVEDRITAAAEPIPLADDLEIPVARPGHLIALKILSRDDAVRPQDRVDLLALLRVAEPSDLRDAESLLEEIISRGFHRERELRADLESARIEAGLSTKQPRKE